MILFYNTGATGPVTPAEDVAAIAEPSTATTEEIATSVNDILAALKAAGIMS